MRNLRLAVLSNVLLLVLLLLPWRVQAQEGPKLTKAPRLVTFSEADYPPEKKAAGLEAAVLLSIEIDDAGKVGGVTVTESAGPDFDAAAVAAAKRFVFEPAELDGVPAPVKITYRYSFVIKTETVKLGPQVNFEGVVLERFKKKPLAGVKVAIVGSDRAAVTDAAGHFEFLDLPPGALRVELSDPKLVTVATDETLVAGVKRTVRYFAELKEEGVDEEKVIRAPRIRKEATETSIRTEEARRVPGTQGDTLKVVQNLPGVARSSFGGGQLVVWGSAPKETRVVIDGVEIPALYHAGGLRSTITSDLVKSIDLVPGGYGAPYGRGLGGLVRVETRQLPAEGDHGFVALDGIDGSAMVSHAGEHGRYALAGRYSWLDRLLPLVTSESVNDYFPIPRYWDAQFKASWEPGDGQTLDATALGAFDRLRRTIPSDDPARQRSETTESSFWRASARWSALLPDGSSFSLIPSVGEDRSLTQAQFGPRPALLEVDSWRIGLRGAYRRKLAEGATLSLGVDALSTPSSARRQGSLNVPAREGDINVFGQPPSDDVSVDDWSTHIADIGPYANLELSEGPFSLSLGLRGDAFLIEASRLTPRSGATPAIGASDLSFTLSPRGSLTWRPLKRLSLTLSGGVYYQAPEPEDLSAVFGNPTLSLQRALHSSLGGSLRLTPTLSFETTVYYKSFDSLVVRSALPTPPIAGALTQEGTGQSYGVQAILRQELAENFFGWLTYNLSRSERTDHPGDAPRLFDYDQTHAFSAVASYDWRGFTFGSRFRVATGAPRTPVTGSFFDTRDDVYQPLFGVHNSVRVPLFWQVDARVERAFVFQRARLNLFLDVQNVTARSNAEEIAYNFDYSQRKYVTGLPLLPVFGGRLEF